VPTFRIRALQGYSRVPTVSNEGEDDVEVSTTMATSRMRRSASEGSTQLLLANKPEPAEAQRQAMMRRFDLE